MLSRIVRQILFTILHLVVNILVAVQNVYHQFWSKDVDLISKIVTKHDVKILLEHIPKLNKDLKHLVILADTDHHTLRDLARIVIWSLVAGIPYISFYDITGELKMNEDKFFYEIERNKKGIPGCIKWSQKPDLNGYTNGFQAHTIVINIFTWDDGRQKIGQCIQKIAEGKIMCKRKSSEFTTQELDEALGSFYPSIPDPDLLLYTGTLCCTYGCLPWQIRLTEFVCISLKHNVNINNYIGALYRYNKCDQRFGK